MLLKYRATESFHDGFQKTGFFDDRTVRISTLIFVLFAIIAAPVKFSITSGFKSESVSLILWFLFIFPLSTRLWGGMSRKSWKLYAGFVIFFLSGLIPAAWGSPVFLILILPAAFFAILLFIAEPEILRRFGYSGKPITPSEILITLIATCLCVFIIYFATVMLQKVNFVPRFSISCILAFLVIVPKYFVVWGVLYGALMKRLLDLKFEYLIPIIFNIIFTMILWYTEPYNVDDPAMLFAEIFSWSMILNLISGTVYYFTRTTRPILIAHAITCIIFLSK